MISLEDATKIAIQNKYAPKINLMGETNLFYIFGFCEEDGMPVPHSPLYIKKDDGSVGKFRQSEHPDEHIIELQIPDQYLR